MSRTISQTDFSQILTQYHRPSRADMHDLLVLIYLFYLFNEIRNKKLLVKMGTVSQNWSDFSQFLTQRNRHSMGDARPF